MKWQSQDANAGVATKLSTPSAHHVPVLVQLRGAVCSCARVATRYNLASLPTGGCSALRTQCSPETWLDAPCTPRNPVQPARAEPSSPQRRPWLEHQLFCDGKHHHRDQNVFPNSKICDTGSQVTTRMLLGKPGQECVQSFQPIFPEQLDYIFRWLSLPATDLCSEDKV